MIFSFPHPQLHLELPGQFPSQAISWAAEHRLALLTLALNFYYNWTL